MHNASLADFLMPERRICAMQNHEVGLRQDLPIRAQDWFLFSQRHQISNFICVGLAPNQNQIYYWPYKRLA